MARVLIGTSGWHYDSWRGPFFPEGLPIKNQLQYYTSQFATAELNGVFYRTPTPEAVKSWREQTGKDFVFAWKASKFITHWKRLSQNSANSLWIGPGGSSPGKNRAATSSSISTTIKRAPRLLMPPV